MTKQEFLDHLGLSSAEFGDLMQRYAQFMEPLNEAQRNAVRRSMPGLSETARSFGPKMSPQDLEKVLEGLLGGLEFVIWGCFSGLERELNPGQPSDTSETSRHKPKKPKD